MNYDEELEFLRKEFKKSEAKFHEAEREGWHTDSNIYEDNMANLGYQIHIHEQAAKADEYEAKSAAFDESLEGFKELERLHEEVRKVSKRNQEKSDVYKEVLSHVIREMESNLGESGESDD